MSKIHLKTGKGCFTYEAGTTLEAISRDFQEDYPHDIILARVDGKLAELNSCMDRDAEIEFITTGEAVGNEVYRRTASMMMLKAFQDVVGRDNFERLTVQYSLDRGYYCELVSDTAVTERLLDKVKTRMMEIQKAKMPIIKKSLPKREAIEMFREHKMYDKVNLFHYRRSSRVNIYMLEDTIDYFYGYMAPSTGYIPAFLVSAYQHGVVLQIPKRKQTEEIVPFTPQPKLFHVMQRSREWTKTMGVDTVGALNNEITHGNINHLILLQEGLQEKLLADIADEIVSKNKRIILIAGPSSSGKTTFSHRLSIQLQIAGLTPHPVSMDDYFLDRELSPRDENGNYNFETIASLDVDLLTKHINQLLDGEEIDVPSYNFITGKREYHGHKLKIGEKDVLVMEGIHGLNGTLTNEIPEDAKYRIYVSALNQINLDEHNRIPSSDGRLLRRIVRDAMTRGNDARETISRWDSVRKGEEDNIFPYQEEADVMFNSAQIYEIAVLKQYAEPLLFAVPRDCPEYQEAKRLLKFLEYFLNIPSEAIPKTSLLREFIGGSCFEV